MVNKMFQGMCGFWKTWVNTNKLSTHINTTAFEDRWHINDINFNMFGRPGKVGSFFGWYFVYIRYYHHSIIDLFCFMKGNYFAYIPTSQTELKCRKDKCNWKNGERLDFSFLYGNWVIKDIICWLIFRNTNYLLLLLFVLFCFFSFFFFFFHVVGGLIDIKRLDSYNDLLVTLILNTND